MHNSMERVSIFLESIYLTGKYAKIVHVATFYYKCPLMHFLDSNFAQVVEWVVC